MERTSARCITKGLFSAQRTIAAMKRTKPATPAGRASADNDENDVRELRARYKRSLAKRRRPQGRRRFMTFGTPRSPHAVRRRRTYSPPAKSPAASSAFVAGSGTTLVVMMTLMPRALLIGMPSPRPAILWGMSAYLGHTREPSRAVGDACVPRSTEQAQNCD